jgi:membrane-associated phospholipid phosphatase
VGIAAATGAGAQTTDSRASLIARAHVWAPTKIAGLNLLAGPAGPGWFAFGQEVRCEYSDEPLSGRSPKFACVTPSGDKLKVKYGEANGEVHGEVAATRLLWALGFGADSMYSVRVRCGGCPTTIGVSTAQPGERLVDPAIIERKMPGREVTSAGQEGWSWLELDLIDEEAGGATRAQRDALKLIAVFLQHTDSKPQQQRLICLDEDESSPAPTCERPFMLINDVGLTFGRANLVNSNIVGSVNFQEWEQTPIWKDDARCVGNLPRSLTGTLKDPVISEDGREFLARRLSALSDAQIRALFEAARIDLRASPVVRGGGPAAQAPHALDEWVRVFKDKRREIVDRRCDALWTEGVSALFGTAPIHWLQRRATHALTMVMNGISLFGYTRVYLGIAVMLAFIYGHRAGAALLLLLALNGVLTDGAKAIVASPRPASVDSAVQNLDAVFTLGDSWRGGTPAQSVDSDDGYGFPSGHVAVTTAFFFGAAHFFGWRWMWPLLAFWIPAMALSRLYLGRHFVGDVLGGLGIGVVSAAIGFLVLALGSLTHEKRARNAANRTIVLAGAFALLSLASGIGPYDTGRFLGLSAGVLLVVYGQLDRHLSTAARTAGTSRFARLARIAGAAAIFFGVWRVTNSALDAVGVLHTSEGGFIAGALPAFALLPAPLYLERLLRTLRTGLTNHWSIGHPYSKTARKTGPL